MIMTETDTGWVGAVVPVCILYIYWVCSNELCLFLPVTNTVKYRKSQFYATNHKSHQNAMYLTVEGDSYISFDTTMLPPTASSRLCLFEKKNVRKYGWPLILVEF